MFGDKVLTSGDNYIIQRGEKRIVSMSITNIAVQAIFEKRIKLVNRSYFILENSKCV